MDPIIDRAVAVLGVMPAVAVDVDELARRLGTIDPDGLATRLAADPRVRVLEPMTLATLMALPDHRAAAYEQALSDAGLPTTRSVALVHPTPLQDAGVAALLRQTTVRLLSLRAGGFAVADAADRTRRAIVRALRPDGAPPSTTHPPGPPP